MTLRFPEDPLYQLLRSEKIDDFNQQTRNENHLNKADVKYAINVSRSVMTYLDELMS